MSRSILKRDCLLLLFLLGKGAKLKQSLSFRAITIRVIPSPVEEPQSYATFFPIPILSLGKEEGNALGPSQAQGDTDCEV
ncbi:MAG: hypothetical protein AAFR87_33905, partial [Bacteroidota bacterium]